MDLDITAFYAGLIALLFLTLSARVIRYRRGNRISLGDSGDAVLLSRIRAQANCAEYAPFGLLLLALTESLGTPGGVVHLLGVMLLFGRVLHALALSGDAMRMNFRVAGMILTLSMMGLTSIGLIAHAIL